MKLALGTVQFGLPYGITNQQGQVPSDEVARMLKLAAASGIDTLDTASTYGASESVLGDNDGSRFKVITKLAPVPANTQNVERWAEEQLHRSLNHLKLQQVEAVLLHRPLQLLEPIGPKLAQALRQLKAQGLTRNIGVSIYDPGSLDALMGAMPCDLVQAPFNLIDRRLETSGWLKRLYEAGIEVHVRSVFLQGLLLASPDQVPPYFAPWKPLWERWSRWQGSTHTSPTAACLGFAQSYPEISRVVVGAENTQQLQELLSAHSQSAPGPWPDIASNDEILIDPSKWKQA